MKKLTPRKAEIKNEKYAQYRDHSHNEKEKPENFGKTFRKLLALLKGKEIAVAIIVVFAAVSSFLTILGPEYLGDIINVLSDQIEVKLASGKMAFTPIY